MKSSGHKLLRRVITNREASLEDLSSFIESKHGDYRDYFPLASLIVSGYVACEIRCSSGEPYEERLLASILYAKASGEKKRLIISITKMVRKDIQIRYLL
ncbi:TPA: hypothetical protein ACSP1W_002561 [Aeromonas veronii]